MYGCWPLVSLIGWLRLPEKETICPTNMQNPCEKLQGPLTYFCMPCYGPGWAHWGGPLRCRHRPGTCVPAPVWTSSIVVSHALKRRTRSNFVPDACTQKENKNQSWARGKTSLLSVSHNCWEGQVRVKRQGRGQLLCRMVVIYKELMTDILSQENCFVSEDKILWSCLLKYEGTSTYIARWLWECSCKASWVSFWPDQPTFLDQDSVLTKHAINHWHFVHLQIEIPQ